MIMPVGDIKVKKLSRRIRLVEDNYKYSKENQKAFIGNRIKGNKWVLLYIDSVYSVFRPMALWWVYNWLYEKLIIKLQTLLIRV